MVADDRDERQCPRCGDPVRAVAIIGLTEAVVFPCQHRVASQAVSKSGED